MHNIVICWIKELALVAEPVEVATTDLAESSAPERRSADAPTGTEKNLAAVLADVFRTDRVSVDGHFFDDLGADSMVMARFCARVRKRADLPSVSMQDVYEHPTVRRLAAALVEPVESPVERLFAEVLADVVGVEGVSVDSHFFDDLGADSMVLARFCARVRKRADLPSVSMQDVYEHPTIGRLAAALAEPAPSPAESPGPAPIAKAGPASGLEYVLCGMLQLLVFLGYSLLVAFILERGYQWLSAGSGLIDIYVRSALFGAAGFLILCTLPIVAKWVLIGRWKPQHIRIWSLSYFRFWFVKTLVRSNPLLLVAGSRSHTSTSSPLVNLYLRALGAKIGRGVVIFSRNLPVCTDLLAIGDGTVIRKDSYFNCYRARAGVIETGTVTLGKDVLVSEMTVLDIGTTMGDGAQLGHASSLHPGQAVPAGERWHGSPARRTEVDFRTVDPARCGTTRRAVFAVLQLLRVLAVGLPLAIGGIALLLFQIPQLAALLAPGPLAFSNWWFYTDALIGSVILFFGLLFVGLLVTVTVPRLLNLAITPNEVYPLYGVRHLFHQAISRITNINFFTILFGDSSYIVNYLGRLGFRLSPVVQTGSNFGLDVRHETPYLSRVGAGTMVADGLSVINADFSNSSFRVSEASIGAHNFLGNKIFYPARGRTGDNCLLATKVMVPVDGDVREGVGLLGSPSFEIPRTVRRDMSFDLETQDELRRRLAAKNRHNLVTIALYLLTWWLFFLGITLIALTGAELYANAGAPVIATASVFFIAFPIAYSVLVARAATRLQALRPLGCSIYDRTFWRHERFWKLSVMAAPRARLLSGTPFKGMLWRLLGMRVGRRLFDDGCEIVEKTTVTLGDDVTLNVGSVVQCHSQEDGAFKSDRIAIGSGCTIGINAFVLYGATMGDGAELDADSFLMKGEEVPEHTRWGGNPAREVRDNNE